MPAWSPCFCFTQITRTHHFLFHHFCYYSNVLCTLLYKHKSSKHNRNAYNLLVCLLMCICESLEVRHLLSPNVSALYLYLLFMFFCLEHASHTHLAQHPSIGTTAWQRIRHGEEKEIGMKVSLCKAYSILILRTVLPFAFYCGAK